MSPAVASEFFTTTPSGKPRKKLNKCLQFLLPALTPIAHWNYYQALKSLKLFHARSCDFIPSHCLLSPEFCYNFWIEPQALSSSSPQGPASLQGCSRSSIHVEWGCDWLNEWRSTIELTVLKLKSDHLTLYYWNPSMFRIEATLLNEDFLHLSSLSF